LITIKSKNIFKQLASIESLYNGAKSQQKECVSNIRQASCSYANSSVLLKIAIMKSFLLWNSFGFKRQLKRMIF